MSANNVTTRNGRKDDLRGTEKASRAIPDTHSDEAATGDSGQSGIEGAQRSRGTVRQGAATLRNPRPRPVTHGKTLGYLITAAQGRIARIDRTLESLQQQIESLYQERDEEISGLEELKQALADWEGRVASLKVTSTDTEVEEYDPTEELTA